MKATDLLEKQHKVVADLFEKIEKSKGAALLRRASAREESPRKGSGPLPDGRGSKPSGGGALEETLGVARGSESSAEEPARCVIPWGHTATLWRARRGAPARL